jgi:hypothetical protein
MSALDFARARAGKSMPAKIAMMAMTTSSSMRVKPRKQPVDDRVNLDGFLIFYFANSFSMHKPAIFSKRRRTSSF